MRGRAIDITPAKAGTHGGKTLQRGLGPMLAREQAFSMMAVLRGEA